MTVNPPEMLNFARVVQLTIEGWGALFCVITAIVVDQTGWADQVKAKGLTRFITADGVLLLSDAIAILLRGNMSAWGYYGVRIANYIVFVAGFLVIITGVAYFSGLIEERLEVSISNWKYLEYFLCGLGIVLVTVNLKLPFLYSFDGRNFYYRLSWNWVLGFITMLAVVLLMVLLLNFYKALSKLERYAIFSALILSIVSIIIQYLHYGISLTIIASSVAVILTFVSHMLDYTNMIVERETEREKWVADEKIRLLYNQIKPHFIYNALTAIYYGLDEDKEVAKSTLKNLSGYLRGSLDVLDERECIDFGKELETIKCYLNIEAVRFGNQIHVVMETEDMDFKIPAFCVQTLVENAVKHGIRKNIPPEGTITIRTSFDGKNHVVEITDDGAGFDINDEAMEDGVHIGLKNTRRRLALMCRGSIEVKSSPGEGTTIIISIPEVKG